MKVEYAFASVMIKAVEELPLLFRNALAFSNRGDQGNRKHKLSLGID